ncbi:Undecaprenyl diphosphate synthase [Pseudovirgaria hyperparasitica]|uniref:Alkyl transferase n=1 Tax=Pseudovirgaria hyperparasitica TaxID=470096 RepID=A0A6A6VTT0_9PEZI|nr:Undecaprenyl diphosphate synthase [Pseudovirgaria hyperparasitica]KAF2753982.1 Undecaprenyl diphosphate synthase [Pseudovirgaria hyperparasitica]
MSLHLSHIRNWFLQSPPAEWALHRIRELLIGALRQGPIPQHVAFVMDGNRRFAKTHHIETVEGHNLGFEALAKVLEVCYKSGVKVVTIYAFSIENFNRSKYEVDALMEMARVKLVQLAQHGDLLDRYGACVRVLGQRDLVKPDVLEAIDRAVAMTSHNTKAVLNVCFPYTSRNEITTAIRDTVVSYNKPTRPTLKRPFSETHITRNIRAAQLSTVVEESPSPEPQDVSRTQSPLEESDKDNEHDSIASSSTLNVSTTSTNPSATHKHRDSLPDPESIDVSILDSHMFTADNPPLDLLVRTSGVERLSDFMLWQCHENTTIVFLSCLWPEFDLWYFLPVLLEWQWNQKKHEEAGRGRQRIKSG